MIGWYRRYSSLKRISLGDNESDILFSKRTSLRFSENAKIIVNGGPLSIGYSLPTAPAYPTNGKTLIQLGKNSKIVTEGPVFIAPGVTIRLFENTTLTFKGNNFVAHNSIIMGSREICFGKNTSLSWHTTIMNDDGHAFTYNGKRRKAPVAPLILEDHVAIQQYSSIMRGVTIGRSSVISAHTVVRENVEPNCLVYAEQTLRKKNGITSGFELSEASV